MQRKSAEVSSYQQWPQGTAIQLYNNARPPFLGSMRTSALAIEASASGASAWWRVYRQDGSVVDTDRYATDGEVDSAGYVPVRKQKNDNEHHLTGLPARLKHMSGIGE